MAIRDATEADLPAIVEIYNASIPGRMATADTEPVSVESREGWFREHDPERRPLWVAVDKETVVGWLSFPTDDRRITPLPRLVCTFPRVDTALELDAPYWREQLSKHLDLA